MAARVEFEISAVDKATSILNILRDNLVKTGGAAGIMGAAFITAGVAVAGALAKATSEAQAYDQQIMGLMASTGGSADQTSRLVQILDDAGIEFGTVTKAMKEMAKDGTEPNIEQLAALSDQFLVLTTGAERGKFLLDKFGKSGMDMARAMQLGGDAIRKMNAGMEGGLILTEENIAASEEYRKNIDELSDAWRGFKVEVGNAVIPVINNAISSTKEYNQVMADQILMYGDLGERGNRYRANLEMTNRATYEARDAVNAHADALDGTLTPAIIAASDAAAAYERNNADLLSLMGTMQSAEDSYAENYKTISSDMSLSDDERKIKLQELAAEHDKTSKTIMFGLMQQQMAMDGLDATETAALMRLGVQWGIFSQTVVNESQRAISYAEGIARAINNIKDKTVRITVIQEGAAASNISYELGTQIGYRTGGKQKNAGGGSYVIPKSYGNEGFNMGGLGTASGGERVSISQNGQQNAAPAMDMKLLARTIVTAMQQAGT